MLDRRRFPLRSLAAGLGGGGFLRLSPFIYNTDEEVERALRAVRALRR